jgi:RNA polymerase sigma factor (sigma-70 family)
LGCPLFVSPDIKLVEMDIELLQQHRNGDESAFAELVRRHLPWIYAMARRRLFDGHLAQDVAQAVFVLLHRKGPRFTHDRAMMAWMHKVAWYATNNAMRNERRRRRHEMALGAAKPHSTDQLPPATEWDQLAPLLDEMIGRLGRTDRDAILLRYYRDLSMAQVGAELGITQEAARKRVERALEKLRKLAQAKNIEISAAILPAGLSALRMTLPPGLTATATGVATAGPNSALAGATGSIVKGATIMMMRPKLVIAAAAAFLIVGSMASVLIPWLPARHSTTAMASDAGDNIGNFIPRAPSIPAPAPAPGPNQQYPKISPFSAVQWEKDGSYQVQVNGVWYKLQAVNNVQFPDMTAFAKQNYRDIWQKRIDEDLVQVLSEMGDPPENSVSLQLQTLDTNQIVTLQNVPMTHENREAILMERNPIMNVPSTKPFTAIRWLDRINAMGTLGLPQIDVEVNGVWYQLFYVDNCDVTEIEKFTRNNYGDDWRKVFASNLAQILTDMKRPPQQTMQLNLEALPSAAPSPAPASMP